MIANIHTVPYQVLVRTQIRNAYDLMIQHEVIYQINLVSKLVSLSLVDKIYFSIL